MNKIATFLLMLCFMSSVFSQSKKEMRQIIAKQQIQLNYQDSTLQEKDSELLLLKSNLASKNDSLEIALHDLNGQKKFNNTLIRKNRLLFNKVDSLESILHPNQKVSRNGFNNQDWKNGSGGPQSPLAGGVFGPSIDDGSLRKVVVYPNFDEIQVSETTVIFLKVYMDKTGRVIEVRCDKKKTKLNISKAINSVMREVKKTMRYNEKTDANFEMIEYKVVLKP